MNRNNRSSSSQPAARDVPTTPVAPEGGRPVAPGPDVPVPPIAPEGGRPVAPGPDVPAPPIAPEGGRPVAPGPDIPVPPIAPEGGRPVAPGPVVPVPPIAPEGGRPVAPGPITPPTQGYCRVRFLHAAVGYAPLNVVVGGRMMANNLTFGELTGYRNVPDGFRTVVVRSGNGLLLRKNFPFKSGETITLAIVNAPSGIELAQINDIPCQNVSRSLSCLRVVNLIYDSQALDMNLYDGRTVFSDVRFKEATPFKTIRPGLYFFYITPTPLEADIETVEDISSDFPRPDVLVSFAADIGERSTYTVYLLGSVSPDSILKVLLVEDPR